jgi:hypothetical protein
LIDKPQFLHPKYWYEPEQIEEFLEAARDERYPPTAAQAMRSHPCKKKTIAPWGMEEGTVTRQYRTHYPRSNCTLAQRKAIAPFLGLIISQEN